MTSEQLIAAAIICAAITVRQISLKLVADRIAGPTTAAFCGVWMVIGSLAIYPFFSDKLLIDGEPFFYDPVIVLLSAAKGAVLFYSFYTIQAVRKESQSSAVFLMSIGLALAAVVNVLLFGEHLTMIQLLGIGVVGIAGLLFYLKGHAHEMTRDGKRRFMVSAILIMIMIILDHNTIGMSNWYIYTFTYGITMMMLALMIRLPLSEWKICVTHPHALTCGVIWAASELYFVSVMVAILPASMAVFAAQLSLPILMVSSALIWKEHKWTEQLFFGLVIMGAGVAMLF